MSERWRLFGTKKRRRERYEVREKEKTQIEAQRSGFNLEKEEQGSVRMTSFSAIGIKRRRSKADFAPTLWRGRRDLNPRLASDQLLP